MSNKLVIYYSRTGNTKKIAEKIANSLSCEMIEIKPLSSYKGIIGWLRAGFQAVKRKIPKIESINVNLNIYDLVILGTPMWGGNLSSPIRAFLTENIDKIKKIAFFYCSGGEGTDQIFEEFKDLTQIEPIATLGVPQKEIETSKKIEEFIQRL